MAPDFDFKCGVCNMCDPRCGDIPALTLSLKWMLLYFLQVDLRKGQALHLTHEGTLTLFCIALSFGHSILTRSSEEEDSYPAVHTVHIRLGSPTALNLF